MFLLEPRDQFDKCIYGILVDRNKAVYDSAKVIQTLMEMKNLNEEEAITIFENEIHNVYTEEDSASFIKTPYNFENGLLLEPRDQFDKCIIGATYDNNKAIYDADEVIETFMLINDWDYEEAFEWFDYNTLRSLPYYEDAPIFIRIYFELDEYLED